MEEVLFLLNRLKINNQHILEIIEFKMQRKAVVIIFDLFIIKIIIEILIKFILNFF